MGVHNIHGLGFELSDRSVRLQRSHLSPYVFSLQVSAFFFFFLHPQQLEKLNGTLNFCFFFPSLIFIGYNRVCV